MKALVGIPDKTKRSTLFPAQWNTKTISDKIVEALLTGNHKTMSDGAIEIFGRVQNFTVKKGIRSFKIKIYLGSDGIINSTWPIYNLKD